MFYRRMAISTGADVAMETANVMIMIIREDLKQYGRCNQYVSLNKNLFG